MLGIKRDRIQESRRCRANQRFGGRQRYGNVQGKVAPDFLLANFNLSLLSGKRFLKYLKFDKFTPRFSKPSSMVPAFLTCVKKQPSTNPPKARLAKGGN
jgi:hypothetical protein